MYSINEKQYDFTFPGCPEGIQSDIYKKKRQPCEKTARKGFQT